MGGWCHRAGQWTPSRGRSQRPRDATTRVVTEGEGTCPAAPFCLHIPTSGSLRPNPGQELANPGARGQACALEAILGGRDSLSPNSGISTGLGPFAIMVQLPSCRRLT